MNRGTSKITSLKTVKFTEKDDEKESKNKKVQ